MTTECCGSPYNVSGKKVTCKKCRKDVKAEYQKAMIAYHNQTLK